MLQWPRRAAVMMYLLSFVQPETYASRGAKIKEKRADAYKNADAPLARDHHR
jgi:hypothetical protein